MYICIFCGNSVTLLLANTMARKFSAQDPDYSDYIRRLLDDNEVEDVDSSSEDIDDSDDDPDYVLPAAERSESSEVDSSEEDDDELLVEDVDEETIGIAETSNLPEFFVKRRNKTEKGPPNAWKSAGPSSQVRVPARNIFRTDLPGIRGRARALGDDPNKTDVWKLFLMMKLWKK